MKIFASKEVRKKEIKIVLKFFPVFYLLGVAVWVAYLVLTYSGGECSGFNCAGTKAMLTEIMKNPQFWLVDVPLWPVLIALEALTRNWDAATPFLVR
jgi:hypothetical protein